MRLAAGDAGIADAQATPKRGGTAVVGVSVAGATLNTQLTSTVTALIIADLWASGLYQVRQERRQEAPDRQLLGHLEGRQDLHVSPSPQPEMVGRPAVLVGGRRLHAERLRQVQHLPGEVLPNIDRTETPDANTFVVHLKEPQSAALEGFDKEVFPLMPKHIYDGKDIPTNEANRAPVGLGPFKFVKWEEGRGITFDAQRALLGPAEALSRLGRRRVHSQRAAAAECALSRRDRRAAARRCRRSAAPSSRPRPRTPSRCARSRSTQPSGCRSTSTPRRETFGKPLVRQALLMAIDRERISKDVYQGLAFPAMNAIPEQFTMLTDPSVDYNKQFAYDPAKAGKMLDEAGFPLKDGKRFTMDFTGAANADAFYAEPSAQIIAAQLARHRHRRETEPDRRSALDQQGLQGAQFRRLDGRP